MAQILVRNLDEDVREKLRELAAASGQSFEQTVCDILQAAVSERIFQDQPLGSTIADRFRGIGLEDEIPELRGHQVAPPELGS